MSAMLEPQESAFRQSLETRDKFETITLRSNIADIFLFRGDTFLVYDDEIN